MKVSLRPLAVVLLGASLCSFLAGCFSKPERDTSIPWSRPANWEGQIPGMGTTPGAGR